MNPAGGTSDEVDVSIIIPSYQRRDQLARLLTSIDESIEQTESVEVVVVLDGSTDGSAEALRRCAQHGCDP